MNQLHLPQSTIDGIVDNPTVIPRLSNSSSSPFNVSPEVASSILDGYTKGLHTVFYVNAALSAFCVFVTIFMIKHKELIRPDEAEMKRKAEEAYKMEKKGNTSVVKDDSAEASVLKGSAMELSEIRATQKITHPREA